MESRVKVTGRTSFERETLIFVSVTALTIYDMCKSADRGMILSGSMLVEKQGGKSGIFK